MPFFFGFMRQQLLSNWAGWGASASKAVHLELIESIEIVFGTDTSNKGGGGMPLHLQSHGQTAFFTNFNKKKP